MLNDDLDPTDATENKIQSVCTALAMGVDVDTIVETLTAEGINSSDVFLIVQAAKILGTESVS